MEEEINLCELRIWVSHLDEIRIPLQLTTSLSMGD
jgi:hypothetical protein